MSQLEITKRRLEELESLNDGLEPNSSLNQSSLPTSQEPQEDISVTLSPPLEIYEMLREDILTREGHPKYTIGLKELDDVLWGLHKKQILTVGARTSHGKSAFAIHLMKQLADERQRVIYFSLEMSREQVMERLFSNFCEIDNEALRKGRVKDEVLQKEKAFVSWLKEAKFLLDDRYGYYFSKIVEICDIIKPDFVILDYIQMIGITGFRNKLEAIEEYVRMIKQLSLEQNFGTILLSQVNRQGIDSPGMENLKHAGILEEFSDSVAIMQWNWEAEEIIFSVVKQRHGKVRNGIKVKFLPQFSKFKDNGR